MFLLLSYLCYQYTHKYLPEILKISFHYLLRKKHIYPKNLLQDMQNYYIKIIIQIRYDVTIIYS